MYYLDICLGGGKFAGEEALWISSNPIWSMNYVGIVPDGGFSGDFLKEFLALAPLDKPYRGPTLHINGDHTYHCLGTVSFEWFQVYETIYHQTRFVYECHFHGGQKNKYIQCPTEPVSSHERNAFQKIGIEKFRRWYFTT